MKKSRVKLGIGLFLFTLLLSFGTGCGSSPEVAEDDEALLALEEETDNLEEEVSSEDEEDQDVVEDDEEEGSDEEFGEEDEEFAEEDEEFGEEDEEFGEDEELAEEDEEFDEEEPVEVAEEQPPEETDQDAAFEEPIGQDEPAVEITDIQFRANQSGGTVVIQTTREAVYQQRLNAQTNQFVVEIANAELPDRLKRDYLMKEFEGASFSALKAYKKDGSNTAYVVIQLKDGGEPLVQQEGTSLLVIPSGEVIAGNLDEPGATEPESMPEPEPEPAPEVETPAPVYEKTAALTKEDKILAARSLEEFLTGDSRYYGKNISVEFRSAEVKEVIDFISAESGVNMVVSEQVTGRVTLKLREVPWDQALIIIMKSKNLGYIRQGSILRIATLKELKAESNLAKDMVIAQKNVIPLKVAVIPVSYAKVEVLATQVKPFLTKGRGETISDKRTSTLVVRDLPDVLRKISRLIKELDIPPAQVMIEAKIIEAGEAFEKRVGVNWTLSGEPVEIGDGPAGPIEISPNLRVQPVNRDVLAGSPAAFGLSIGTLDVIGNLDATLALAERDNLAKIVSSPRIIAVNKEPAEISQQGQVLSLTTISDQGGNLSTAVQRSPVELTLKVTPQITAGGSVIMDVNVSRQFAGPVVDQRSLARAVNGRSAKTKVLVKNGQTAVIGGIYQTDETEAETGVPGLKDVPVVGWLFKSRSVNKDKNELLIFLTPRILSTKEEVGS